MEADAKAGEHASEVQQQKESRVSKRSVAMSDLFDYVCSGKGANGFTKDQAMSDLDLTVGEFNVAVRDVRALCADDECNLVAESQGQGEQWKYQLVGTFEDGAAVWIEYSQKTLVGRLRTAGNISKSIVNATDGRSADGRRARTFDHRIENLLFEAKVALEDLQDRRKAEEAEEAKNGAV